MKKINNLKYSGESCKYPNIPISYKQRYLIEFINKTFNDKIDGDTNGDVWAAIGSYVGREYKDENGNIKIFTIDDIGRDEYEEYIKQKESEQRDAEERERELYLMLKDQPEYYDDPAYKILHTKYGNDLKNIIEYDINKDDEQLK